LFARFDAKRGYKTDTVKDLRLEWASIICKVHKVGYLNRGNTIKVVAFLTEHAVVDRIIDHLKLTFVAERPPPPQVAFQELFMDDDPPVDCFS
jgi:hypothetical protein